MLCSLKLDPVDAQGNTWNIGNTADMIPMQMRDQRKIQVMRLQRHLLKMLGKRLFEGKVCQRFAEEQRLTDEKERNIGAEPCIVEKGRSGVLDQHSTMDDSAGSTRKRATNGNKLGNSDTAATQESHADIRKSRGVQDFPFLIRTFEQKTTGQSAFNSHCRS